MKKKTIVTTILVLLGLVAGLEFTASMWADLRWQDTSVMDESSYVPDEIGFLQFNLTATAVEDARGLESELKEALTGPTVGARLSPSVPAFADIRLDVNSIDTGGWNPFSRTATIVYTANFTVRPYDDDSPIRPWTGRIKARNSVSGTGWLSRKGTDRLLAQRVKKTISRALMRGVDNALKKTDEKK